MRAGPFLGVYFVHCWAEQLGGLAAVFFLQFG